MARTRIKICGLTTPEDALDGAKAGADALGLVFYPQSPRAVSIDQAIDITAAIPAFVSSVALLVNADDTLIASICERVRPSMLQFHGDESATECARWKYPYIKALRMKPDIDVLSIMAEHQTTSQSWCRGILLDAYHPGLPGGTGESFDWSKIPPLESRSLALVLAGGLTPENVQSAVTQAQPWAVDVSSGVEYAPGRKCSTMIRAFIQGVLNAAVPLP